MAEPNFKNRTIWTGDNLDIMRGMDSDTVDLIYLDPPFNSNKDWEAFPGTKAAGAKFKDVWTLRDLEEEWHGEIASVHPALYSLIDAAGKVHSKGMKAYLIMMAMRILEMGRILKPTGSIWLHCDPTASHYLKMLMDCVFGKDSFRNEIAWCYAGPSNTSRHFPRKHDILLFYAASSNQVFNKDAVRIPYKRNKPSAGVTSLAAGGRTRNEVHARESELIAQGKVPPDWWQDIGAGSHIPKTERTGYPTQKPLKLLKRIIEVSSNPEDMVLDPFCGCATTLIAAHLLGRQWAGIDQSPEAVDMVLDRLTKEALDTDRQKQKTIKSKKLKREVHVRKRPPKRTDLAEDAKPRHVGYKKHKNALYGDQEGVCNGCELFFYIQNFDVDHVVPRSKGGGDEYENLQLLCASCNSIKGTGDQEDLKARLVEKGILAE